MAIWSGQGRELEDKGKDISFDEFVIQMTFEYGCNSRNGIKMFIVIYYLQIVFWNHAKYQEKEDNLGSSKEMGMI